MDFSILNEIILSILLGLTQGITEFIPISSTAHMRLIVGILAQNRDIGLITSNVVQLGTLVAVVQYFKDDLIIYYRRIKQYFTNPQEMKAFTNNFIAWIKGDQKALIGNNKEHILLDITISQLIVGTIPIVIFGLLLSRYAQTSRNYGEIAAFLIAGSILMAFAEYQHKKIKRTDMTPQLSFGEVLLVGLFQSLAIFPGISRSGATLSGALLLGRTRPVSVRFSFLLSIPAILLAGTLDAVQFLFGFVQGGSLFPNNALWTVSTINLSLVSLVIATLISYFSGLAVLKWLLNYLAVHSTKRFIVYRVVLAAILLILSAYLGAR